MSCSTVIIAVLRTMCSYVEIKLLHQIEQHVTPELLNGKTWFQAYIVEQHKSYRMVVKSWESVQAYLNAPLFARGTFCERL